MVRETYPVKINTSIESEIHAVIHRTHAAFGLATLELRTLGIVVGVVAMALLV